LDKQARTDSAEAQAKQSQPTTPLFDTIRLKSLLQSGGALGELLPNFEERQEQVAMLAAVSDAFLDERILLVEAGTGVGKSLAYGLPAAAFCKAASMPVVISTATINLQEQLVNKDLPLASKALGLPLAVVLVKGRGNYLCRRRLSERLRQGVLVELGPIESTLRELDAWAQRSADGSRSDLSMPINEGIWEELCSDADACLGRGCPARAECFYAAARMRAEKADILVVNHHLLFADLALRLKRDDWLTRGVLPPFKHLILDEAQELEDTASNFFGLRLTRLGSLRLLSRLMPIRHKKTGLLAELAAEIDTHGFAFSPARSERLLTESARSIEPQAKAARALLEQAFDGLATFVSRHNDDAPGGEMRTRLVPAILRNPEWTSVRESFCEAAAACSKLAAALDMLVDHLVDLSEEGSSTVEARASVRRLHELADSISVLINIDDDGLVRWVEVGRRARGSERLLGAPLDVSALMNEALFAPMNTTILTSATLAVDGSLKYLCRRLGVDLQPAERIHELVLESPFDYPRQAALLLPTDMPEPDQEGYEPILPEAIYRCAAASGGRALVLFTSWTLMQQAHEIIKPRLLELGINTLCQGEEPRDRLLQRFREDETSVLFGTDSFWQGVDVIGSALRNVIITRLPFDVPNEPLLKARQEACRVAGGRPFIDLMLPRAVLKLKQGFGRLIRSRSDFGVVAILDQRLAARGYGQIFLRSLPPAEVFTDNLPEIAKRLEGFLTSHAEILGK
jgi:ATP-dependent DNA helicase DinG